MSRDSEARDANTREIRSRNLFESLRDLPAHLLPPGMQVKWATETVLGQYQEQNMAVVLNRDGYQPLTTKDLPGLQIKTLPGREAKDEIIRNGGGQVLVGRPLAWGQEDRDAEIAAAAQAEADVIRGHVTDGLNPKFAQRDQRQTTAVRRNGAAPQFNE